MTDLTSLTVEALLDRVAERAPTPGGGSVAAAAGALSCALGRMAMAYSVGPKSSDDDRKAVEGAAGQLRRADELLRALVTGDAEAYGAMTAAAKALRADASSRPAFDSAVLSAIAVPMEVAALAAHGLAVMEATLARANPHMLSDVGVAAALAEATVRAARYMVWVNAPQIADPAARGRVLSEIETISGHAAARAVAVEGHVRRHLEHGQNAGR